MSKTHVVAEGDHLASIAARNGFRSYHTLWDHPDNAELKARRKSPHILLPGDRIVVPDRESQNLEAATGKRHTYFVDQPRLELHIAFQEADGAPIAGVSCDVDLPGAPGRATTDDDGRIEIRIPSNASFGTIVAGDLEVAVRVGYLSPIDELSGWQGRLMNLGYYAGEVGQGEDPRLRLAVEEFQLDSGLPVTGAVDAATQAALLDAHGC